MRSFIDSAVSGIGDKNINHGDSEQGEIKESAVCGNLIGRDKL